MCICWGRRYICSPGRTGAPEAWIVADSKSNWKRPYDGCTLVIARGQKNSKQFFLRLCHVWLLLISSDTKSQLSNRQEFSARTSTRSGFRKTCYKCTRGRRNGDNWTAWHLPIMLVAVRWPQVPIHGNGATYIHLDNDCICIKKGKRCRKPEHENAVCNYEGVSSPDIWPSHRQPRYKRR